MAENLNFEAGGKCYGEGGKVRDTNYNLITLSTAEIQANCKQYGRLYNWETAMKSCLSGWHLPSKEEWEILDKVVGGYYTAGKYLKTVSGWNYYEGKSGNGTDTYGFSALPGGGGYPGGSYDNVGNNGSWWSSSEGIRDDAFRRSMRYYGEHTHWYYISKRAFLSVRCLQNATPPKGTAK